ncbi:MAG: aminotransferase class V-fold PLP-dependent enzyme, partial [Patescibacteria group bacterium]
MDYAATTPMDERVFKIMRKYQSEEFGNPSSMHTMGIIAKRAVEDSRKKVASVLNCRPQEIYFTGGGTEG